MVDIGSWDGGRVCQSPWKCAESVCHKGRNVYCNVMQRNVDRDLYHDLIDTT